MDNRDNRNKASAAAGAPDPLALLALDTTGVAFPGGSLVGVDGNVDGNAFSVMGFVLNRLRRAGNGASVRERYQQRRRWPATTLTCSLCPSPSWARTAATTEPMRRARRRAMSRTRKNEVLIRLATFSNIGLDLAQRYAPHQILTFRYPGKPCAR